MVEALDRHPAARRPYRRLFDRAARADGIHGRGRARISGGRRERDGGDRNIRLEAPMIGNVSKLDTSAIGGAVTFVIDSLGHHRELEMDTTPLLAQTR